MNEVVELLTASVLLFVGIILLEDYTSGFYKRLFSEDGQGGYLGGRNGWQINMEGLISS